MPTYKTPDVYVEEISLLPRSVAEVETALPAFIGYTAKATDGRTDLTNVPTLVRSLVEFESLFGGEPPVVIQDNSLILDAANSLQSVRFTPTYHLHDAIRLFYNNGGGRAYIVSVGSHDVPVEFADFEAGLAAVRRKDEPTMLLFPDAVRLGTPDFYTVQQLALRQCGELKDRFAVLDLLEDNGWPAGVEEFRNRIGVNHLSYGAAYTPHLQTTLPRLVTYRELRDHLPPTVLPPAPGGGAADPLDPAVRDTLNLLDDILADVDELNENDSRTLRRDYDELVAEFRTAAEAEPPVLATVQGAFQALLTFIYDANNELIDRWANNAGPILTASYLLGAAPSGETAFPTLAANQITSPLRGVFLTLNQRVLASAATTGLVNPGNLFNGRATHANWTSAGVDAFNAGALAADASIYPHAAPANDGERIANMRAAVPHVGNQFRQFADAVAALLKAADDLEREYEDELRAIHPLYASVARAVGAFPHTVPPSGAVAGVYAAVDAGRGVWKAPANVSLSSVVDVTELIDNDAQADLNVDTGFGKSINAIRPFTGRGILVWGARTLAGNDNEWRYVSVRRFFIMVEESLRKSTLWAVFEPNDANLWVKVKSMIENYLTEKWREGALAGAKPEHAFFVNVGLGSTMTPQDILEGRLIVEIGLAVVRPAEFIILRFSHLMQQS
jgi:hypothetical protein